MSVGDWNPNIFSPVGIDISAFKRCEHLNYKPSCFLCGREPATLHRMKITTIPAADAPPPPRSISVREQRRIDAASVVDRVDEGIVVQVELGGDEKPRSIMALIRRAAKDKGVAVKVYAVGDTVYVGQG